MRNRTAVIVTGIVLVTAVFIFIVWYFRRKTYGTENPLNRDPVNYSKTDFFKSVLSGLSAPVSDTNVDTLMRWQKHEGGKTHFNPLNTTMKMNRGETNYNSAGVKNYPDFKTGVEATVKTLKLSYYKPIVDALKAEIPSWKGNTAIVNALNTWGTTNYANSLA